MINTRDNSERTCPKNDRGRTVEKTNHQSMSTVHDVAENQSQSSTERTKEAWNIWGAGKAAGLKVTNGDDNVMINKLKENLNTEKIARKRSL